MIVARGRVVPATVLVDDLWVDPLEIADGFITAPERPGHGLRFREEVRREFVLKG